jgi:multicomponent Na+:H+ antiporter subunit G
VKGVDIAEGLTSLFLVIGSLLILVSAIGVIRLPDVLCRAHAVAKALTLGIFLMLMGLWVWLDEARTGMKIILAVFFQMVTIPVASHLIGLLAYHKRVPRWRGPKEPAAGSGSDEE